MAGCSPCCKFLFECRKRIVSPKVKKKEPDLTNLYVFDFDHTIIDDNSDRAIVSLLRNPIPQDIRDFYDGSNWTEYMDKIMIYVAQQRVSIDAIQNMLREIPLTPGMGKLLDKIRIRRLEHIGTKLVIISDSNDFFIETVLNKLSPPVHPDEIIANRGRGARIAHTNGPDNTEEEVTYLKIEGYENQTTCPLCPKNLCKGAALKTVIRKHGPFLRVYYTGDGRNDICAATELSENDVLFVRKGYTMEKAIASGKVFGHDINIKAKIYYFDDGNEIAEVMGFN